MIGGISMIQVDRPSQIQASRQPTVSISHCTNGGCNAMEMGKPRLIKPRAKPRFRSNHCAVMLEQFSINEPWPRKRRPAKPIARNSQLEAKLNIIANAPKPKAMIDSMVAGPCLSTKRPMRGRANAAINVAPP